MTEVFDATAYDRWVRAQRKPISTRNILRGDFSLGENSFFGEPREKAPCGTDAAHTFHKRHGEPVDEACRKAGTEANRIRYARRVARKKAESSV